MISWALWGTPFVQQSMRIVGNTLNVYHPNNMITVLFLSLNSPTIPRFLSLFTTTPTLTITKSTVGRCIWGSITAQRTCLRLLHTDEGMSSFLFPSTDTSTACMKLVSLQCKYYIMSFGWITSGIVLTSSSCTTEGHMVTELNTKTHTGDLRSGSMIFHM